MRLRVLRLLALTESPWAYGSTLEWEEDLGEAEWRRRMDPSNGPRLWAVDDTSGTDEDVGLAGSFTDPDQAQVVHLVAMWVAPSHRGRGIGELLVEAFVRDAAARGWEAVELRVVDTNVGAWRLYERCGFTPTGETYSHLGDEAVRDVVMQRMLRHD